MVDKVSQQRLIKIPVHLVMQEHGAVEAVITVRIINHVISFGIKIMYHLALYC